MDTVVLQKRKGQAVEGQLSPRDHFQHCRGFLGHLQPYSGFLSFFNFLISYGFSKISDFLEWIPTEHKDMKDS